MRYRTHEPAVDLGGEWQFAISHERVAGDVSSIAALERAGLTMYPATVPGNLELDLLANGLVEEPFVGMNVVGLRAFEDAHVYYARTFRAPECPVREFARDEAPGPGGEPGREPGREPAVESVLEFEGIDCFADVYLNGHPIHRNDNMLIEHTVPVGGVLRPGEENTLVVAIEPAVGHAQQARYPYPPGLAADATTYESLYVRKAPHMYGWDIMPRALSAGLWRPVRLRYLPVERLEWAWLETESVEPDGSVAQLVLHYRATTCGNRQAVREVRIEGTCGASRFDAVAPLLFDAGTVRLRVPSPRLWWPRGRGDACMYDVRVQLVSHGDGDGVLDTLTFTHGIRTVELERTSVTTEAGDGEFCFRVNGERVFVLGTNWVPADAYHSRDAARIPAIHDLVDDLGCNMVRCWGGNVYEDDAFFDLCDRRGILVWQDFAMACALYPQDTAFQARLRDEVTAVVRRLRQHACLAVWAGDNECDESYVWTRARRRDPNANVLTRGVIPTVLRDEDPSRPYLPSSPYVDEVAFRSGDRRLPEDHLWGPRDYYKGSFYTSSVCHFASEIGYVGCPEPSSMRRFLSPDRLWPYADNEEWRLHSTAPLPGVPLHDYRVELIATQIRSLFGIVPDNLVDYSFASQASQAEGLKFFIEMFRAAKWRRTGIIWWNVMDGWPQVSDAVVDYYFARKRAYDVVKRAQSPILVMLTEPSGQSQEKTQDLLACNDTRDDTPITYTVRDIGGGTVLASGAAVAAADSVTRLATIGVPAGAQCFYLVEWTGPLGPGRNHYLLGRPPFSLADYRTWVDAAGL